MSRFYETIGMAVVFLIMYRMFKKFWLLLIDLIEFLLNKYDARKVKTV